MTWIVPDPINAPDRGYDDSSAVFQATGNPNLPNGAENWTPQQLQQAMQIAQAYGAVSIDSAGNPGLPSTNNNITPNQIIAMQIGIAAMGGVGALSAGGAAAGATAGGAEAGTLGTGIGAGGESLGTGAAGAGGIAGTGTGAAAGAGGVDAGAGSSLPVPPPAAAGGAAGGAAGAGGGMSPSVLQALPILSRLFGGGGGAPSAAGAPGGAAGMPTAGGVGMNAGGGDLSWLTNLLGGGAAAFGLTQNPSNPGLNPQQQTLIDAGTQTYQAGLDPRGALHDRTQQQIVDASRASDASRGINMSPVSAGVENKAVSDFNIDWQNQQLGRQATGLQAMTGANQAATGVGQLGLQNRNFGANQNAGNMNALLTALTGGSGGPGAGAGGTLAWLSKLLGGGGAAAGALGAAGPAGTGINAPAAPGMGGGVDQFGNPISGGMPATPDPSAGGGFNDFTGGWGDNVSYNNPAYMTGGGGSNWASPGWNTGQNPTMPSAQPSYSAY